jgi:antitoxin (DNA-binding transcriptional repressor) of toxin-antitoxin stability system
MAFVGIRELSHDTSRVIREFEAKGEPLIITRQGQPIGTLMPVSQRQVEDIVLATAPEFRPAPRDESAEPPRLRPLREYAAERGITIKSDEEEEGEPDGGHVVSATWTTEVERLSTEAVEGVLGPYRGALAEPSGEQLLSKASAELTTVNDRALAAIAPGEIDLDEVRIVTAATAELYRRVFERRLEVAAAGASAPDRAIPLAGLTTGLIVKSLSGSAIRASGHSIPGYVGVLRVLGRHWGERSDRADARSGVAHKVAATTS